MPHPVPGRGHGRGNASREAGEEDRVDREPVPPLRLVDDEEAGLPGNAGHLPTREDEEPVPIFG